MNPDANERNNPVRKALAANLPSSVAVYRNDELIRTIACPNVKRRHMRVMLALRDLQWTKLELLDKKGHTLDVVVTEEHPEFADDNDAGDADVQLLDPQDLLVIKVTKLVIEAQKPVLTYRSQEAVDTMRAMHDVMKTVTTTVMDAVRSMSELYQMQVRELRAQLNFVGENGVSDEEKSKAMAFWDKLPQMVQTIRMLQSTTAPAAAPKTNGANGTHVEGK